MPKFKIPQKYEVIPYIVFKKYHDLPEKKKPAQHFALSGFFRTRGGNRTRTILLSLDFESSASTNSATRATVS